MMKRLLLGVSFVALSAGAAMAAPAVVESSVNLRNGPGTEFAVIATLPAGATVNATDCAVGWCRVSYDGEEGYASRAYLDIETAAVEPYYYPSYGYYGYYGPYAYYEPFAYAFGLPDEGFEFGFVGHRHEFRHERGEYRGEYRESAGPYRLGGTRVFATRQIGHPMRALGARPQFAAHGFAASRGGEPHFAAGRMGAIGHAMPGGFGAHMASMGHVGAGMRHVGGPGFGGGHHR
ncbi:MULTISPECIES: SH3 domain-containing protein [unclassified Bradyrhizobium]|uniref:SH3 domain-containing protein n=1 Tax=unclassified Bradyrhizobium TaxID=2631580 RepID=UPI00247836E7|nr:MULTISPECIES: SH3 domain-containing protein [unclassified Bradyrhizobium]WGS20568.1 SH3 domain-containing protein [Bradyrhizobium sp. ISRA463]WGS27455.1 SH3 domain-containing protein [Bradyrhizobium sp. ISRA464]